MMLFDHQQHGVLEDLLTMVLGYLQRTDLNG
jgi:hypothetical protein